ncbi:MULTISPECIES: DUF5995 family protein [Cyanophyceae]|uniref:DUF5995 family protein n=1 Tax=Cyanophyceae TaxID=3028117 RepID=UPI00168896A8|nr:DUF5995 family protein [Trichocoleus sp. FACHB-69]MBD1932035.1 hypothetical protein [Trichocoleus sp. FACHB-69]
MKNFFLGSIVLLLALSGTARASAQNLTSAEACQKGEPECVDLVIEEMERRYELLAELCDHDALFALTYLRSTETFLETLDEIGYDDPASVVREDALFAEYYFRPYDAYHSGQGNVPPAWQIAFDAAQNRSVAGAGNLLLGFNAHIQRDLPFVLYDLYTQGTPVSYSDHNRANQFLQQVDVTEELVQKFDPTIDDADLPGEEDDQQQFQLIAQWRERAFRNFERLRDASTDAERTQVAAEIEGYSAAFAQGVQLGFAYPPGTDSSARDAYCQRCQEGNHASVPEPHAGSGLLVVSGIWLLINKFKPKRFASQRS